MDDYIKKIYDMMYSPIVNPYNLLENAKISNYSYVKYYKSDEGLVTEMECEIPQEGKRVFYYHFDNKDNLQKIVIEHDKVSEILFDREMAIQEARSNYYNSRKSFSKAI